MRTPFAERLAGHAADPSAPPAFVLPDAEIGYAELFRRVEHCASWLRDEGLTAHEVVGITIADDVAHLTVCFALLALGVPQVSLPTYEPANARLRLARALDVTRVIAVDPHDALPGLTATLVVPGTLANPRTVPAQDALNADPGAVALLVASSGSTGEPKLIAMTGSLLGERLRLRSYAPRDRALGLTTTEDIFGKSPRLYCAWRGATAVLRGSAAATPMHALGAYCTTQRVTRLTLSVLQATTLIRDEGASLPVGLNVFVGGARVPMRLREAFRAQGRARLHVEYGTREAGLVASTFPEDREPSIESVGPIAEHAEVEVVDGDGRSLPPGEIGEIRVRAPYMVHGYHRDPATSARQFRDGWFHTGDLGSMSPRGSLCLHGRADDVMVLSGIKIYPTEIERVLERDPAVKSAAAFPLRSALHGDIPAAAVEWQGDVRPDAAALLARARAELGVRAPRKIVVVDALPRTPGGKVAKRELARTVGETR